MHLFIRTRVVSRGADTRKRAQVHRTHSPAIPPPGLRDRAYVHRSISIQASADPQVWTGTDAFAGLGDRRDAPPIPLPPIGVPRRVTLVRHGQSTWNAESRIQGSSNFSVLTEKGVRQAETARDMLKHERYDKLFYSPLARASKTAEIVWAGRPGPTKSLASLREIDLYSFQGLVKDEGKARFGAAYDQWKKDPANFEIDGQVPVRELWYRASLAWQVILAPSTDGQEPRAPLVVAHNAINQALVCTALGLPPTAFRRVVQSNAAATVLDFAPSSTDGRPIIAVEKLNQGPSRPFKDPASDPKAPARLVLVHRGHVDGGKSSASHLSSLGHAHSEKVAELLSVLPVSQLFSSGSAASEQFAAAIRNTQPNVEAVRTADCEAGWLQAEGLWVQLKGALREAGPRGVVAALVDEQTHSALVSHCLGLEEEQQFCLSPGGISVIDFESEDDLGTLKCLNYSQA